MADSRARAPAGAAGSAERNTLTDALTVVRRRWRVIAALVVACVAVAVVRYELTTKTYDATASVQYDNSSLSDAALQVAQASGDPTRDGATNVLVATSLAVAQGVKKELNSPLTPAQLLDPVSVQASPNANVIEITASTPSPAYSARLANAFADQYIAFERQSQVNGIAAAQTQLQRQLSGLPADSPNRAALEQSIQRLAQLLAVADTGVQIISRATVPTSPSGISLKTSVILGILIGLALSLVVVLLLESLDRRIDSIEGVTREYRLPMLAAVQQRAFREQGAAAREGTLEPYRILRTALDLAAVTRKIDSVLVTSAVAGEGKTTVAADLAHAIALTGRRVTLLELDLRRPTFGKQFGLDPRHGFTSVVAGQESLAEALAQPFPDLPEFLVLPSGPLPPNPAELLESAAVTELLNEAVSMGGIVVIDTPPLNPVADTHVLLSNRAVSAVIVVARIRHAKRHDVEHAREILDRHMLEPLGVVVTGMPETGRYGYEAYRPAEPARDEIDGAGAATLERPLDQR